VRFTFSSLAFSLENVKIYMGEMKKHLDILQKIVYISKGPCML